MTHEPFALSVRPCTLRGDPAVVTGTETGEKNFRALFNFT